MKTYSVYLEILDFRDKTGLYPAARYSGKTDDETYKMFQKCQAASNNSLNHCFIVDLCSADGSMIDTVPINEAAFRMVTGNDPAPLSHYIEQCDEACTITMVARKKYL